MSNLRRGLILALLVVTLSGCATGSVAIKDVVEHPREYAGKRVTIEGEVTGVFSLFVIKYFTVNDGTGTMGVISEHPLPRKGEKIKVTGTVKEALSLGDQTLTMLHEEGGGK